MYYIRYPFSYLQVEDVLHERGVDVIHETIRYWVDRFGVKIAGEIRKNVMFINRIGSGIWTRSSWKWMANHTTSGEL